MFNIRKFGRSIVLPHKKIEKFADIFYKRYHDQNPILDFGAGTLFWTEKFINRYNIAVYAVDPLFKAPPPPTYLFADLRQIRPEQKFSMIFTCDVLHHIKSDELQYVLNRFVVSSNLIIIKDIEAENKIGNLQNKIHDFIINHQIVNDIYSSKLKEFFIRNGFRVKILRLPKLGYPHFLMAAYK